MSLAHRIRIRDVRTLSDDWYVLKKTTFDWLRSDGSWQTLSRETYDRGNGATLLPFDPVKRTILLTRQFRYPAYVSGHDDLLIEAAAGLLDGESPENRIRLEVEEELGLRLQDVRKVFACFMSPGSVTEQLHFFVGRYDASMRLSAGGGARDEGEDIEVMELTVDEALQMIRDGRICDGKTVMLIQYAALNLFAGKNALVDR
ncbi:MAG: NUDIX domain-containing protein [Reyranella sp.]|jgi:nudix-type nucleoside diphosphatase (YffH/AdpP family)|uniref:NUDIX domain-containing protein n=1 Tax=Reyranella sp. TaxID=1929291 RepID=UPI0025DC6814|nr:NUDIX domain-containing protein [Reyranella sp.]MBR2814499.1 NUDIX domain-containing protein [Reyranella sp.]